MKKRLLGSVALMSLCTLPSLAMAETLEHYDFTVQVGGAKSQELRESLIHDQISCRGLADFEKTERFKDVDGSSKKKNYSRNGQFYLENHEALQVSSDIPVDAEHKKDAIVTVTLATSCTRGNPTCQWSRKYNCSGDFDVGIRWTCEIKASDLSGTLGAEKKVTCNAPANLSFIGESYKHVDKKYLDSIRAYFATKTYEIAVETKNKTKNYQSYNCPRNIDPSMAKVIRLAAEGINGYDYQINNEKSKSAKVEPQKNLDILYCLNKEDPNAPIELKISSQSGAKTVRLPPDGKTQTLDVGPGAKINAQIAN